MNTTTQNPEVSEIAASLDLAGKSAVNVYDSKTSKARTGEILLVRRIRKTAKAVAAGKEIKVAKCVSVSRISRSVISANIEALMPAIEKLVHEGRTEVFATLCDSQSYVTEEEVSIERAIEALNAGRLDSESVVEWFADCIMLPLSDAFIAKGKTDEEAAKIVDNHKELFVSLISGRSQFTSFQRAGLRKVLDSFTNEDDSIAAKFRSRLDSMERKEVDVADFL